MSDLAAQPEATAPQACGDQAATKAAYRFWDHEAVTPEQVRAADRASTGQPLSGESTILAIQNATKLNWASHPATQGLGAIDAQGAAGLQVHTVLAVSAQGLRHQQVWARDPGQVGKKHQCKQRPIEHKESYRWLRSVQAMQAAVPEGIHGITVADCEADIYDLFALPRPEFLRATDCTLSNLISSVGYSFLQSGKPASSGVPRRGYIGYLKVNRTVTIAITSTITAHPMPRMIFPRPERWRRTSE